MSFSFLESSYTIKSYLRNSLVETVNTYNISYASNVEEVVTNYLIRYSTTSLIDVVNRYVVRYDSLYGDSVTKYTIRYFSGRALEDSFSRYTIRYSATYPESLVNTYSLIYATTGPSSLSFRSMYRLRYESQGVDEVVSTYNIRYNLEYFKERSQKYYIKYNSETPFMFDTQSVILRNEGKTSVLFYLQGRTDNLDNILYVFSNLPRYQLVEFQHDTIKPHIKILTVEEVKDYNLFRELSDTGVAYTPSCYILITNVEEVNSFALDIYDKHTLEKRNINKSFFFNLDSTEFHENAVTIGGERYDMVNYSSNYYNYKYLNFMESEVTPLFKVSDNCCFNTKIKDTNSNACSPF